MNFEKSVVKYLEEIGCCDPCCLRYIHLTKSAFLKAEETICSILERNDNNDRNDDGNPVKKVKKNICIACLGLLQDIDSMVEKIARDSKLEEYDCETFACAISLPMSLAIRSYSILVALRKNFSHLSEEIEEVSLKEAWKWKLGQKINEKVSKTIDSGATSDFLITINMGYKNDSSELETLIEIDPKKFKERAVQHRKFNGETFSRKAIFEVLERVPLEIFEKFVTIPPAVPNCEIYCESIECVHNPIYIAGRYLKFSRQLSQTPWIINGQRIMESSVQEIICQPLIDCFNFSMDKIKFSSSGREDCDVRCLGRGRPFVLEISDPKKTKFQFQDFRRLENLINKSTTDVQVRDLQLVPKSDLIHIKQGEEHKTKTYKAYCISKNPIEEKYLVLISNKEEIEIDQKTPIRVLHRRPLARRTRVIHKMKAQRINENNDREFLLELETQAGTYIKEFVHGDFGRTKPNLSSILNNEIDIVALDVMDIVLDWPKPIDRT